MASSDQTKTYEVLPNVGEKFTITGTKAEVDGATNRITVWLGDEQVASVAGGSFRVVE